MKEIESSFFVRVIKDSIQKSNSGKSIIVEEDIRHYEDVIYLEKNMYKEIFGKAHRSQKKLPERRGIVKISNQNKNFPPIFRQFRGGNHLGVTKEQCGLTLKSIHQIELIAEIKNKIKLSKGSKFFFYWKYPLHEVRVAFRLGFLSIVISLIAIGITLIK